MNAAHAAHAAAAQLESGSIAATKGQTHCEVKSELQYIRELIAGIFNKFKAVEFQVQFFRLRVAVQ